MVCKSVSYTHLEELGSGQGEKPDGVGAAHEQPESASRGTGADGADLQLSFFCLLYTSRCV